MEAAVQVRDRWFGIRLAIRRRPPRSGACGLPTRLRFAYHDGSLESEDGPRRASNPVLPITNRVCWPVHYGGRLSHEPRPGLTPAVVLRTLLVSVVARQIHRLTAVLPLQFLSRASSAPSALPRRLRSSTGSE